MPARSEQLALADMVDNCVNARQAMGDLSPEAYWDAGWEKHHTIERCIEIISEAAKALSAGLRAGDHLAYRERQAALIGGGLQAAVGVMQSQAFRSPARD